jgi:hypothetical protein
MPNQNRAAFWRTVAITGIGVLAVSLGAFGIDFVTIGRFEFISDHYELFLLGIGAGVLLLFVGLIAWAKNLGKQGRTTMGTVVFIAPIATCVLAAFISGTNVHGPFFLFLFAMIPVSVLGLALLLMAAAAPRDRTQGQPPHQE